MQRRGMSFLESCCNTGSGFIIALITWELVIEPLFGIEKRFSENLGITTIFTSVSIARSYVWRRLFNRKEAK